LSDFYVFIKFFISKEILPLPTPCGEVSVWNHPHHFNVAFMG